MVLLKFSKRGIHATPGMIVSAAIILIFLIGGLVFAGEFIFEADNAGDVASCRGSMILNAYVRGAVLWEFWKKKDERVAINCPAEPELTISYSDVSQGVRTKEGIKNNIMKTIAEEMVTAHHKAIGDMHNAVPFRHEDGIYCLLHRKIKFDDTIQRDDDLDKIDTFMDFLINQKSTSTNAYGLFYSQYLYGYERETKGRQEFKQVVDSYMASDKVSEKIKAEVTGKSFGNIEIDTSKEYDVMHIVVRGSTFAEKWAAATPQLTRTAGFCGAAVPVCMAGLWSYGIPVIGWITGTLSAAAVLTCAGSGLATYYDFSGELDFYRVTVLVEDDKVADIGCTPGKYYG